MKGFATSLAIVLSFCAGIVLFDFQVTLSFLLGTCIVVGATYLYNQPDQRLPPAPYLPTESPSVSSRHHFTSPGGSPGARYTYPQSGAVAHSSVQADSFSHPPLQRRSGSAVAGSQTPDHILGFQHGLVIEEDALPHRGAPSSYVNGAPMPPTGPPPVGNGLASAHDVAVNSSKRSGEFRAHLPSHR